MKKAGNLWRETFSGKNLNIVVRRRASQQQAVVYRHETMSTTSGSESLRSRRSHLSRSKSLDQEGGTGRYRSRSLDPYQDSLFIKRLCSPTIKWKFQKRLFVELQIWLKF
jgi:hypothetical protein